VNSELERMWKEAVVSSFKTVLSRSLSEQTEENRENPLDSRCSSRGLNSEPIKYEKEYYPLEPEVTFEPCVREDTHSLLYIHLFSVSWIIRLNTKVSVSEASVYKVWSF
jgi:hypothetical protein